MITPLPAASPSALITTGRPKSLERRLRREPVGGAGVAGGGDAVRARTDPW